MIQFACPKCRSLAQVEDHRAGTDYVCHSCGQQSRLPIGTTSTLPVHTNPLPSSGGTMHDVPPSDLRRRGIFANRKILIGIAVSVTLLIAGGLIWWFMFSGPGLTDELTYLPDNFEYIASIKISSVVSSDGFKAVRKELEAAIPDFKGSWEKLEKGIGVDAADIQRVTVAGVFPRPRIRSDREEPDYLFVLKTRTSVKASDLFKEMELDQESKVGSFTIYESPRRHPMAMCLPDGHTILLGNAETLRSVLKRGKKAEVSPGMQAAMKRVDFAEAAVLAVNTHDFGKDKEVQRELSRAFDGFVDGERLLQMAETMTVQVKVGSKVEVEATLYGKDTKAILTITVKSDTLAGLPRRSLMFRGSPTTAPARFAPPKEQPPKSNK